MKDQNKEKDNSRQKSSTIFFVLLALTILQFIHIRKSVQTIDSLEDSLIGLMTTQTYYDDLTSLRGNGLDLEEKLKGRIFCAYREGLSFKFKFEKQQILTWVTTLSSPKIYITQEAKPTLFTNYHREGNQIFWNIELLGNSYSFNGVPILYEDSPSLIRGKTDILIEFTDDHSC